ncbi:MAG: hypothetical protein R2882_01675 [Gemmatimonadales bacterium]
MRIYPGRLALCLAAVGAGCHPQPAGTPEPLPSPEIVAVSRMGLEVAVPAPASIVVFELTAANTLNLLTTAGAEAAGRLEIRFDAPAEQRWEERRDTRSQPVADRLAALLRRVTATPKFGFSISDPLPGAD